MKINLGNSKVRPNEIIAQLLNTAKYGNKNLKTSLGLKI